MALISKGNKPGKPAPASKVYAGLCQGCTPPGSGRQAGKICPSCKGSGEGPGKSPPLNP